MLTQEADMWWPFRRRRKVRIRGDETLGSFLHTLIKGWDDKTLSSLKPLDEAWLEKHINS